MAGDAVLRSVAEAIRRLVESPQMQAFTAADEAGLLEPLVRERGRPRRDVLVPAVLAQMDDAVDGGAAAIIVSAVRRINVSGTSV